MSSDRPQNAATVDSRCHVICSVIWIAWHVRHTTHLNSIHSSPLSFHSTLVDTADIDHKSQSYLLEAFCFLEEKTCMCRKCFHRFDCLILPT
jgi:hypothetical protein